MRDKDTSRGPVQRAAPSFVLPAVLAGGAAALGWLWLGSGIPAPSADSATKPAPSASSAKAGKPSAADTLTLVTAKGRHDISLEIADTPEKQTVGLMFRKSMAADHGMLFPYPVEHELTMWMKNTYISLDMVFIRADGTVHRVARNTEPMSEEVISSKGPVKAVLELVAGAAERYGVEPGTRVEHPIFAGPGKR